MRHVSMLTYIPRDRLESLASGKPLPTQATGAALFADISGFTRMTHALTRTLGARRGAEELMRQLNRVYDALCDQIDRYHGTIIGFSGDAVACWFGSEATAQEGSLLALTCAFNLQKAMQAFEQVALPNGETLGFSLKVVVTSGTAYRYLVGDPDIQIIDVMVGDTINRMAQAETYAKSGEVVVDAATVDLLSQSGHRLKIEAWRGDDETEQRFAVVRGVWRKHRRQPWKRLQPTLLGAELVRPYLMPALYNRDDEMLTELRQVVALFITFGGIDYEYDRQAHDKLNRLVRWAQAVLVRYGGTLIQLTTAEKGGYFYFAFGAPIAYDNNAELAAQAALALSAVPPELDFVKGVHIGMSQGIMRTGAYGGKMRRTYGVVGDDTNLAARLMQAAGAGEILVSERLAKELKGTFVLEAKTPILVKGKDAPIPVARLMGKDERESRRYATGRQLVGRGNELAALTAHLTALAQDGRGGSLYVWGEPGIGKNHLINAARTKIDTADRLGWYHGAGDQIVQTALHVFMPFLTHYFRQELGESDAHDKAAFDSVTDGLLNRLTQRDAALYEQVRGELEDARWFLGALLGLRWRGSPYENLDPKLRFGRSLEAISILFCAESLTRPFVFHIEDAHRLDEDSKALLLLLAEQTADFPFLLLLDSRLPPTEFGLDLGVGGIARHDSLHIRQLAAESVRELGEVVLKGEITDRLSDFLLQRAGGNPFFTEQWALDLAERNLLVKQVDGRWEIGETTLDEMPSTISGVLIARLDRLVSEVRSIVQIASVIGQEFAVPILASMTNDEPSVRLRVKQAESETIWTGLDDIVYHFRHVLLRDAAYNMQLHERLRELHALAGKAIEQLYAADLTDKYPDLAYHYESAGLYGRAIMYLTLAAQQMMRVYANREAMKLFERAALLSQQTTCSPLELATIYEGLGDLHEMGGEYPQALTDYNAALAPLTSDYPALRTKLLRKKGEVLQKWGRYEDASLSYESALIELQADLQAGEACRIYAGLSMINYRQNQMDDAVELAMLALMMAEGDTANTAQALQNLGILYWKRQDWQNALDYDAQSLALWQSLNSLNGVAAVHNNLGLVYFDMDNIDTALTHYALGLQAFEKVGNLHGLACVYDNLGRAYQQKGDHEEAMRCLEQAVTILAKIGLSETEVFSSMWVGGTW